MSKALLSEALAHMDGRVVGPTDRESDKNGKQRNPLKERMFLRYEPLPKHKMHLKQTAQNCKCGLILGKQLAQDFNSIIMI